MKKSTSAVILIAAAAAAIVLSRAPARAQGWDRLRSAALPVLGWKLGFSASSFGQLTFFEAVGKAGAVGLRNIEGFSSQKVSAEIPKNLDYNLTESEVAAVRDKLKSANVRMPAYFIGSISADENACRRLFEFAKALNVETIVSAPEPDALPLLDKLAEQYGINVAVSNRSRKETPAYWDPKKLVRALEGRGKRVGACADIGFWLQEGIKPIDGLRLLKDRVITLHLRDRSAMGRKGRDVPLGSGVAGLQALIGEVYRLGLKPTLLALDYAAEAGDPSPDLARSADALEKALQPVTAARVNEISRTTAIRGPDRLTAEDRQKIEAAIPPQAPAKPKKPRKLLVFDLNVAYPGHRSIPAANLALELMGKKTGAYEAVFSNDLANFRYAKLRQFDAVYLNNTVGMIFVDPEVREGLTRFVREGGGLAGNHGTPHASMDWPEFSEMIGARGGTHRDPNERVTVKLDDPDSPINAAFAGKGFVFQDEFFRWPTGPYSREKLHILTSIDVEKTDMNPGPPCPGCDRPDNDYAISWIRSYGKGRVFYCSLGHNATVFWTPPLLEHFLAGIQFILGDLEADATPSARIGAATGRR